MKRTVFSLLVITSYLLFSCNSGPLTHGPLASPRVAQNFDRPAGSLLIAGGAVKANNASLFNKFIELSGGAMNARIAIFTTASGDPSQGAAYYKETFNRYGVPRPNILIIPIAQRDDLVTTEIDESFWRHSGLLTRTEIKQLFADEFASRIDDPKEVQRLVEKRMSTHGVLGSDEIVKMLEGVTGIWFGGGWQGRIRDLLMEERLGEYTDGPVLEKIRELHHRGAVIGGTSAGAAIMSNPMIDGGGSLEALLQGATENDPYYDDSDGRVYLTPGLGFWPDVLADQHFIRRGRFGRLIAALAYLEMPLGVGIDENTAIVVQGDEIEVVGETGAIIIDMSQAVINQLAPMEATGIRLSYLEEKDRYNFRTGEFQFADYKVNSLRGDEAGSTPPLVNGNLFAPDALLYHMIRDLVDHKTRENFGIAYESRNLLQGVQPGDGIEMRFYKRADTNGFWGRKIFSGTAQFSVFNVYVDIRPIKVRVE